ncbi:conserved hypothetical protein [Methanosalsum zhilinae DSM 4017]|uniref:DUF2111 domain-containing protein n=1 Tax=Methanosalsum zhilinae (strain DSM 4017 / NBRC 107636 / OCM 62 / WeN5) TaxID=679901 RepID=F7XL22_METZD|nr:DUF2111 domain-containing protein [Methanosalsum zhilinae]AEH60730.1 conserved hypothetical protein [Methanosalsum zhilinae DSM 4017]
MKISGEGNINYLKISEDSGAEDLEPMAFAIHSLLGLPTTMRSLNKKGIRLEKNKVLDTNYTGPVLEEALKTNKLVRKIPDEGQYKGKAVIVAPLRSKEGDVIAAIGVVDLLAALDIMSLFDEYPGIVEEVEKAKKEIYREK